MSTAENHERVPSLAVAPGPERLPLGFVGVLAPMNSLGFAPFAGLGLVYEGALVLTPAAAYQISFSFQQERIVRELLDTPFSEATAVEGARTYHASAITDARLVRHAVLGHRLVLTMEGEAGGPTAEVRFIVQRGDLDRLRRRLVQLLDGRFVDEISD
jgi:hypothetical protein